MGMPHRNDKLLTVSHLPTAGSPPRDYKTRHRHGSAPGNQSRPPSSPTKTLDRKHSAPELPPIGIKPTSPNCSQSPGNIASGSPLELNIDSHMKRTRRSPLSPTSTNSSHGGSSRSQRLSPAAGGLGRSKTWTGELNNSQHGSGNKLETLYEMGHSKLEPCMQELSIITEAKPSEAKESKLVASTSVTSPPPIDRHMNLKSTQTITVISSNPLTDKNNNDASTTLPATPSAKPQLTANRLSQENLKRLRRASQTSSTGKSSIAAKASSDTGYDTDDEKEQRIVDWLIGVETSQTEQPPDVTILTNEPRDNAIHIVYDGD